MFVQFNLLRCDRPTVHISRLVPHCSHQQTRSHCSHQQTRSPLFTLADSFLTVHISRLVPTVHISRLVLHMQGLTVNFNSDWYNCYIRSITIHFILLSKCHTGLDHKGVQGHSHVTSLSYWHVQSIRVYCKSLVNALARQLYETVPQSLSTNMFPVPSSRFNTQAFARSC